MKKKPKSRSTTKPAKKRAAKRPAKPKWKPAPPALASAFERLANDSPGAQVRKMFGYPAAFANGHLFAGVFQDLMFVRLHETDRVHLLAMDGARPFEPMAGRPMKEYVVLPPSVAASDVEVRGWLTRGLAYANTLPPKKK